MGMEGYGNGGVWEWRGMGMEGPTQAADTASVLGHMAGSNSSACLLYHHWCLEALSAVAGAAIGIIMLPLEVQRLNCCWTPSTHSPDL